MKKDLYKYFSLYKELYGEEIYLEINSNDKRSFVMQSELNSYLDSIKDCLKCPLGKSRKNISSLEPSTNLCTAS